jgi:hypothetical protein
MIEKTMGLVFSVVSICALSAQQAMVARDAKVKYLPSDTIVNWQRVDSDSRDSLIGKAYSRNYFKSNYRTLYQ